MWFDWKKNKIAAGAIVVGYGVYAAVEGEVGGGRRHNALPLESSPTFFWISILFLIMGGLYSIKLGLSERKENRLGGTSE